MLFDVVMPLTLFAVTVTAVMLNEKSEKKLKKAFEEKKFGMKEAVLLVAAISITVSLIVFIPRTAIMTLFLFSYSTLLFMFTYIFSDVSKQWAKIFLMMSCAFSLLASVISLFNFGTNAMLAYGGLALLCPSGFSFVAYLYEYVKENTKGRAYVAILPPALFLCLYLFFNETPFWFFYLMNVYAVIFAVLVIIYLGNVFTWNTTLMFAGLLTLMDVILVFFTGSMVSAAKYVSGLKLPIVITVPTVPAIMVNGGTLYMSLGLGDFFLAGLIGVQTAKRFGKKIMLCSTLSMCLSFFLFEAVMLNFELGAFPGTLMIVCGWIPILFWLYVKNWRSHVKV